MLDDDYSPTLGKPSFRCPSCGAIAQQAWSDLTVVIVGARGNRTHQVGATARCVVCEEYSLWRTSDVVVAGYPHKAGEMVFPAGQLVGPDPDPYMPDEVREVYSEARRVASISPRSAAALLRLGLERLLRQVLNAPNINLNSAIGRLVKERALPTRVQRTMDVLRLHGNDAVHPVAEIRVEDQAENVEALMRLLNYLIAETIGRDAEVDALWETLPQDKRNAADKRDGRATEQT